MTPPHFSASCHGHFGELLQGMFSDNTGKLVRALVTLPCPQLVSRAELSWCPARGTPLVSRDKPKVAEMTALYCQQYGIQTGFRLEISSSIPVAVGMGSSTADLVAAIRVLDRAFGLVTEVVAMWRLVLRVEKACDPALLSGNTVLFAQREGRILEDFLCPLPPLAIVGFNLMPGVEFATDKVAPADYSAADLARFAALHETLRQALQRQDIVDIAGVATQSALINQRYFPKPRFDELLDLQAATGALGVCVAHSGTVAGLIFPAESPQQAGGVSLRFNAPETADNAVLPSLVVRSLADVRYPA